METIAKHENKAQSESQNMMLVREGSEISDAEKSEIASLRAALGRQQQHQTDDQVDDWTLRRFLRARDMNIEKASNMFLEYRAWHRSFIPNGSISASEVAENLSHNKLFMQGLDRNGRPVVVVLGGRHKQGNVDEFRRFVTFTLDKICTKMPKGQEKFTAIADLEGWGYSNIDIQGCLAAMTILRDCYPERLSKLLMVHVPYAFMAAWKIANNFLDDKSRKKIVFVEDWELNSTLLSEIEESQLPETYGGKLSLVPIQDC